MKAYKVWVLCLGIISMGYMSCEKDNGPSSKVEVSEIIWFPDKHISTEFSVLPDGDHKPFTISWQNPDSLAGFGPHTMRITSDLMLEYTVTDAKNRSESFSWTITTDTIDSLKYDYRNYFAGRYKCDVAHYYNGETNHYTDTLTISKAGSFSRITIQTALDVRLNHQGNTITYLNSGGYYTYPDGEFSGYHSGAGFSGDSINYTQSGPLGYYYTNTYRGIKIN